ncbi:hypothetical protein SLEP1_g1252 [Rubroshorea leprosula]|uniref:Cullin neddylation domain-containing protein n=1 Tax=Rubroshorea leprosula TaxID=152421 RepID=A0AAV5HK01_9ROSI|nr:hypothetical protein SLEP1_g1252 [Rubroshorea leprosula]
MDHKTTELDQGWDYLQKGITKLKKILEEQPVQPFSGEEYMMLYTTIYNMCTQKPPHDYSQQLYDKYREAFEGYITSTVLPSLIEKHDEFMLRELVKRWLNHKVMVRWLSRFFHYLDRYFIAQRTLPALNEVGLTCFREQVYNVIKDKVRDAVIILIPLPPVDERKKVVEDVDKDRRYAIDAALVRIMKSRKVLGHQQLVSECVEQLSCMFKPDIKAIKKRMEDLITRDYLERDKEIPNLFRLQLLLVPQSRKIIELHDKYMAYVTDCFSSNTIFHKALKEALEVFCNKTVAGVSSAEFLATFCDNILKKGGSEKLGDEAIEETLEKVAK